MTDASASLPIDPRIRERREAVRRDEGRRRLRFLIAAAGVVAVAALGYGVTRSPLLDVDTIRVRGAANTTPAAVAVAGGLDRHPQLTDFDAAAIAARIERLPWVARATVVRHWPGTVEVSILERTPVVAVPAGGGGWASVDATGRVVELTADPPPGMARIETATGAPAPGDRVDAATRGAVAVVQALPASLLTRVSTVRVVPEADIELVLDGGPLVRLGPPTELRSKLVALTTLVQRTNLRGVRVVDVRVPTAPVLTRT